MVRRCCVPNCQSNYKSELNKGKKEIQSSSIVSDNNANKNELEGCSAESSNSNSKVPNPYYITAFKFPKGDTPESASQREAWIKNIPRKNWKPSKHSVVCIKHFEPEDVSLYDEVRKTDGTIKKIKKFRALLKPNAVPRIFPGAPKFLKKPSIKIRLNPSTTKRKHEDRCNNEQEECLKKDKITDNDSFRKEVDEKVRNLKKDWIVAIERTQVLIYFLENLTNIPQIGCSVTINNQLIIQVCVRGNIILPCDLSWVISNNKLARWSQLENILSRYREPTLIKTDPTTSLLDRIRHFEESLPTEIINDELISEKLRFFIEQMKLLFMKKKEYAVKTILQSLLIYQQSSSSYAALRNNILTLPHPKYIQLFSTKLDISASEEATNEHVLKTIAKKRKTQENKL